MANRLINNKLLFFTTIVPTLLSLIYYGFIASDVYISESRFVVRSPEKQTTSTIGLMLKSTGFSKVQDDSYTVQEFILSRDALAALDNNLSVKKNYSSTGIDVVSRFDGFGMDNSFEAFYVYYLKKINLQLESASSITTLTVKAFSPELAQEINKNLVDLAEELVNHLNERARQDMIGFAAAEVFDAQAKAKASALALSKYRNAKGVIDPEKQSTIPLQQIAKLQDELIATKGQLLQLEKLVKENPQIPVLKQKIELLQAEIYSESNRVAGGEKSLAEKAVDFHRLELEKEFSDKMLASAMSTLEQAKNEAQRQQVYLEKIVLPSKPDKAMEPKRIRGVLATFAVGIILFLILTMLFSGMKEHLD